MHPEKLVTAFVKVALVVQKSGRWDPTRAPLVGKSGRRRSGAMRSRECWKSRTTQRVLRGKRRSPDEARVNHFLMGHQQPLPTIMDHQYEPLLIISLWLIKMDRQPVVSMIFLPLIIVINHC